MAASPAKRLRRTQKKPDRFGKRLSASSHNEFFGQVSSNSDTDDTSNRNFISLIVTTDSSSDLEIINSGSSSDEMHTSTHEVRDVHSTLHGINDEQTPVGSVSLIDHNTTTSGRDDRTVSSELTHEIDDVHSALLEINDRQIPFESVSLIDDNTTTSGRDDRAILSKLDEILKRISFIEKNTAKMEVRLRNLEQIAQNGPNFVGIDVDGNTSDNDQDFIQRGLPVANQESLDKLEADLKSENFRRQMVIFES